MRGRGRREHGNAILSCFKTVIQMFFCNLLNYLSAIILIKTIYIIIEFSKSEEGRVEREEWGE